jgi:Rrf2 family protein
MKISTRGRYGLRAMLELARCHGGAPVLMSVLAERESLSRKYLHTLLTALKEAGLVRSVRGAGGGFLLTRAPSKIRLSEVLHALEGSLCLVDCVADERACSRAERCTARRVWAELSETIESVLEGVSLEDLIASENQACSTAEGEREKRKKAVKGKKGQNASP